MASYDVDPNNVGATQNPYDFGGVSVSILSLFYVSLNLIFLIITAFFKG